jgi:extracellular elastinolytic metalloproteinase
LEGKYNDHPGALEYLALSDGSVALAHVIQVQNDEAGTWYEAFVDAHSGEILSVTDFVSDASYTVLPITKQDPTEGLETIVDPQDLSASPDGWHTGTATAGNNVVSYKGSQSSTTSESGDDLEFDYPYNTAAAPSTSANVDASRVQGFYISNVVHDFAYKYGFTEAAFNFQNDNFGNGGSGNDRVLMSVQDASGTNNANFATPPE